MSAGWYGRGGGARNHSAGYGSASVARVSNACAPTGIQSLLNIDIE